MKTILTMSALLLLASGPALAGSGYDGCIKEEKALKAREAGDCHGLKYLLNPSACYVTQKALKEYTSTGKCRNIGIAEGVDFTARPVMPEKKAASGAAAEKAGGVNTTGAVTVKKSAPEAPQQELTLEQLRDENARLKAEVSRLTAELEQFGKACR